MKIDLFKQKRPIACPVIVFRADPDVGNFQLDTEHNDGCHKANTREDFGKGASTRFVLCIVLCCEGGLLSSRDRGRSERLGGRIQRDGGFRESNGRRACSRERNIRGL